jgi:hypothetical protein
MPDFVFRSNRTATVTASSPDLPNELPALAAKATTAQAHGFYLTQTGADSLLHWGPGPSYGLPRTMQRRLSSLKRALVTSASALPWANDLLGVPSRANSN